MALWAIMPYEVIEIIQNAPAETQRIRAVYIAFVLLAIIKIVLGFVISPSATTASTEISYITLLLEVVLTAVVGWEAKRVGRRPALTGMYANLFYGVPQVIASFFTPVSLAQIEKAVKAQYPGYTQAQIHQAAQLTASARPVLVIVQIVIFIVIGLFFGWIGSMFAKKPGDQQVI